MHSGTCWGSYWGGLELGEGLLALVISEIVGLLLGEVVGAKLGAVLGLALGEVLGPMLGTLPTWRAARPCLGRRWKGKLHPAAPQ
jgi:hypothetical protein